MFADSLLESHWAHSHRRRWTTLVSFSLQALAVGALFMLPLLYTEGLPQLRSLVALAVPASGGSPAPPVHARSSRGSQSNMSGTTVLIPQSIPKGVSQITDTEPLEPNMLGPGPGVPFGIGDPNAARQLGFIGTAPVVVPKPPTPASRPVIVSHMMEGNLISKPQPVYPPLARAARIQGPVLLRAIISKNGTIENLQVFSGHPMLVHAAIDAVSQWRYRPYMLNGSPVEVETQVTVNFVLSGG